MKKDHFVYTAFTLALFAVPVWAYQPLSDSAETSKRVKKYSITAVTRLHSMGMFSYNGRLVSDNPAIDFYFNYNRTSWGFQVFKAADLYDLHTPNNFTLALIYKNFRMNERLTITPYTGFALDQLHSFADHGSDISFLITTTLKLTNSFTIEHSSLLPNLVLERKYSDWVNRIRLLYTYKHFDAIWLMWHNNGVFDGVHYESTGFSVFYSRVPVSKRVMLSSGMTGLVMMNTSNEERIPQRHGIVFTIAATIH